MPRGVSRLDEALLQGRLWTPALLGPALWLTANDLSTISIATGVNQWRDKSGFGRHFGTGNASIQPVYRPTGFNGRPCLENVSADSLSIGASGLGRNVGCITCAIVGSHPAGAAITSNSTELVISVGTSGQSRFSMSPNPGATSKYGFFGRRLDTDAAANFSSSTDSLPNRGNPWIRIGERVYSAGVGNHWTNGVQDMTALAGGASGTTSDTDSFGGSIFTSTPNGTKIAKILLFHFQLTPDQRLALEGYLAWDCWGDGAPLQALHPFKNRPPLIGD
jgi:hypothetical protein